MTGRRSPLTVRYVDAGGVDQVVSGEQAREVAFEDCGPARVIPSYPGQWHTPGRYWAATTATLLAFESFLECQWLTQMDFDPTVAAMNTQALELRGRDGGGSWRHVPDVFLRRIDGSVRVVDVKHPRRRDDAAVVRQQSRTAAACKHLGWNYRMVDALPMPRHATIAWLAGYRRPLRATAQRAFDILAAAVDPIAIGELASRTGAPELARPVIFHLLWHHRLVCDMDLPLREHSLVSANPAARS